MSTEQVQRPTRLQVLEANLINTLIASGSLLASISHEPIWERELLRSKIDTLKDELRNSEVPLEE